MSKEKTNMDTFTIIWSKAVVTDLVKRSRTIAREIDTLVNNLRGELSNG